MRHTRPLTSACLHSLAFSIFVTAGVNAQFVRETAPFPVIESGQPLEFPFFGGLNSPKPSLVDLDRDGLIDLMIGDGRGKISFLRNTGTAQAPVWTPTVDRLGGIDAGTWYLLVDLDDDNDLDLVCDGRNAMAAYYRNDSPAPSATDFVFTFIEDRFGNFATGFNNMPDFADIDGDGDLDFFFGNASGGLDYYENIGDKQNPVFDFITHWYDSVLAFPVPGGAASPSTENEVSVRSLRSGLSAHGFSAIKFGDIDMDGDLDLIYGDINNSSAYLFENYGNAQVSDLQYVTQEFLPINTQAHNHATFGDVDSDGDLDMIIGAANFQPLDNLHFYRNEYDSGVLIADLFVPEDLNLIKTIDVGSNAMPAFGDIDDDGDQDMLVGDVNGMISLYTNTGDAANPRFTLTTKNFGGVNVGTAAAPELADWDSDGDLDLLVGVGFDNSVSGGTVRFWRNVGTLQVMSLQLVGNLADATKIIKVDLWAVPRVVDFDRDGVNDLILGEWDLNSFANVLVYENVGSAQAPSLTLQTNRLLPRTFRLFSVPEFYDWDGDGALDLILGNDKFGLTLFRNVADSGSFPDSLTLMKEETVIPGADDGEQLAIRFVDIDGDGDDDVFVGEEDGGVNFYRNTSDQIARGDVDGVAGISAADITYLINYLYLGGPAPLPKVLSADVDCSGVIDLADAIRLITFFYASGPAPCAN